MKNDGLFCADLKTNLVAMKKILPSEDVPIYEFLSGGNVKIAVIYADGMVNKQLIGDLAARPLSLMKDKKLTLEAVKKTVLFPEIKTCRAYADAAREILDGNPLLLADGVDCGIVVGAKLVPVRAVTEPPTSVAVKGPREGFIEDLKINMALVRKRLKTGNLRFEYARVGKQTDTAIAFCYLDGIADKRLLSALKERLEALDTDAIIDSSYIATFLSPRRYTLFKETGTTEKPDVFSAKIAEGRIGIFVDGSPIALTVPYTLSEDFQSGEDYFVSPCAATVFRILRFFAVAVALLLPAFYVSSQLFKIQLIPLNLTLTIAGSIRGLPLSPSLEMFLVLSVFEILKEASIRMPKYVGLALSVVGALVLGDAAVSAGFVSTPAIIVVAFSGICLYTVPDFVETGSVLRWIFLIVAGSVGPFGIVLFIAFLLYYLITADAFGSPPLAPFAPMIGHDLKDSMVKSDVYALSTRPALFRPKNKRRLASAPPDSRAEKAYDAENTDGSGVKRKDSDGVKTDMQRIEKLAEKDEKTGVRKRNHDGN